MINSFSYASSHLSQLIRTSSSSSLRRSTTIRFISSIENPIQSNHPSSSSIIHSNHPNRSSPSQTHPTPTRDQPALTKPSSSNIDPHHHNRSIAQPKCSPPKNQVIKLTPKAIDHLSNLLDGSDPKFIRIGLKNKGCAGLAYNLDYVDRPGKFDEVVTTRNDRGKEIKVLIDSRALLSIIGSTMDWQESQLGNRFVFDNPNIKESCGCGESFLVWFLPSGSSLDQSPPPPSISIKHSSLGKLGWSFFHFQINRKILREAFFFFFFFWKDQPWFFFFFLSFFHHWNRPRTLACIVIINDSYLPILPSVLHQDFLLLTLSFVSTLLSSPCPSSIPSSHFIPLRSSRKEPILIKIKLDKTPQRVPHQLWLIDSLRPPLPFTQFLIDPCVMLRSVPFDYPFDVTIF